MILIRLMRIHANIAAFWGNTKEHRREIRNRIFATYQRAIHRYGHRVAISAGNTAESTVQIRGQSGALTETEVFSSTQDFTFPVSLYHAPKVMVFFVPEHATMSGGIFSIFSIAKQMRRLKPTHGFEVIMMTRPNQDRLTYFRNPNFQNSENVYRVQQIVLCKAAEELYVHVPEYAIDTFVENLTGEELDYFRSRRKLYVNVLNQNIRLMRDKDSFDGLRRLAHGMSQSVAHHAYFNQAFADKYGLPTLLLPAYTDLSEYSPSNFNDKEKLIIYSLDEAPLKDQCLARIRRELPEFSLVEIRDITFDKFMDLATRCLFSITFGEGFDGYLAQPIHQGGIGFAVYNDEFFPSSHFKHYYNIFSSAEEMVEQICDRIRNLLNDPDRYADLSERFRGEYAKLYLYDEYVEKVGKLSLRQFDIYPSEICSDGGDGELVKEAQNSPKT